MAANCETTGLYQILNSSNISHAHLSPNSNHYYWTTYTANTTNTSPLSQQLLQDTINEMKKSINRQTFGIYPAPQIDYRDHIVRKGTKFLDIEKNLSKLSFERAYQN